MLQRRSAGLCAGGDGRGTLCGGRGVVRHSQFLGAECGYYGGARKCDRRTPDRAELGLRADLHRSRAVRGDAHLPEPEPEMKSAAQKRTSAVLASLLVA